MRGYLRGHFVLQGDTLCKKVILSCFLNIINFSSHTTIVHQNAHCNPVLACCKLPALS